MPHTTAGRPQAPALTGARAARSQPLHLQKHSGSFRLGTREDFLSWKEDLSKQDLGLPSSESKAGAVGRSSVMSSAVLTHCSRGFSPTAVLFRPASLKIVF